MRGRILSTFKGPDNRTSCENAAGQTHAFEGASHSTRPVKITAKARRTGHGQGTRIVPVHSPTASAAATGRSKRSRFFTWGY